MISVLQVSNEKDPIVFVSSPRSPPRSFLQVGLADTLLSVSKLGVVGTHSWHPHDRHGPRGFTLDVDPTINNAKYVTLKARGREHGPLTLSWCPSPSVRLNPSMNIIACSHSPQEGLCLLSSASHVSWESRPSSWCFDRFFVVQTGSGTHPTSYTLGIRDLP